MMEKGESWLENPDCFPSPWGFCRIGLRFDDELYLLWRQSDKLWKLAPIGERGKSQLRQIVPCTAWRWRSL